MKQWSFIRLRLRLLQTPFDSYVIHLLSLGQAGNYRRRDAMSTHLPAQVLVVVNRWSIPPSLSQEVLTHLSTKGSVSRRILNSRRGGVPSLHNT
jgi:hypothetical protein